jgi:hypothetical protein
MRIVRDHKKLKQIVGILLYLLVPLFSLSALFPFCWNHFFSTDKCKEVVDGFEDDGLDKLVCALPPSYTERFGEVCWAQGGVGFGWWPSVIYDPRLTVGNARQLARKNLGRKHLVYFFECHDAPFAVLTKNKITKWEDGIRDDYHLGKAARATGKVRTTTFQQALHAANVEVEKPIERRMDWNHQNGSLQPKKQHQQQHLTSPNSKPSTNTSPNRRTTTTAANIATAATTGKLKRATIEHRGGRKRRPRDEGPNTTTGDSNNNDRNTKGTPANLPEVAAAAVVAATIPSRRKTGQGFAFLPENRSFSSSVDNPKQRSLSQLERQSSSRRNLNRAIAAVAPSATATRIECSSEDGELYCKLVKKVGTLVVAPMSAYASSDIAAAATPSSTATPGEDVVPSPETYVNVGFIKLESRKKSTFASARVIIESELVPDCIPADSNWKFLVPSLGPVSLKQEASLGPLLPFLQSATTSKEEIGDGTMRHPLQVVIVDAPLVSTPTAAASAAPAVASVKGNSSGGKRKRASRG